MVNSYVDQDFDVIIPWRSRGPEYERQLDFVLEYFDKEFGVEPILADDPTDGPFSPGMARNAGLDQSSADVVLFADSDTLVLPPESVADAIRYADINDGLWLPFMTYVTLASKAARVELDKGYSHMSEMRMSQGIRKSSAYFGGTFNFTAVNRETIDMMLAELGCFFSPRFVGWGHEDKAAYHAVEVVTGHAARHLAGHAFTFPHGERDKSQLADNSALRYELDKIWDTGELRELYG